MYHCLVYKRIPSHVALHVSSPSIVLIWLRTRVNGYSAVCEKVCGEFGEVSMCCVWESGDWGGGCVLFV